MEFTVQPLNFERFVVCKINPLFEPFIRLPFWSQAREKKMDLPLTRAHILIYLDTMLREITIEFITNKLKIRDRAKKWKGIGRAVR